MSKASIKIEKLFVLIIFTFPAFAACEKLVEINEPTNELSVEKVYSDSSAAASALNGIYSTAASTSVSIVTLIPEISSLTADDFETNSVSQEGYYNNNIQSNDPAIFYLWSTFYKIIYQSNLIIESSKNSDKISETLKNQLTAEALFFRAFSHFHLKLLFGDIPLILTSDVTESKTQGRSTSSEIEKSIIEDLESGLTLIGNRNIENNCRVNKICIMALLSRIYLVSKQWDLSIYYSTKVLESKSYATLPSLNTTFKVNSSETIFQLWYRDGFNPLAVNLIPGSIEPDFLLTNDLVQLFTENDLRKNAIDTFYLNGSSFIFSNKYQNTASTIGDDAEYFVIFRSAEMYLNRAESKLQLKNIHEAIDDINKIRERAGIDLISNGISSDSCAKVISKERRLELFGEWIHRWSDLKRSNHIDLVLKSKKSNWQATDSLYPIPAQEILKNRSLSQNAGY